MGSGGRLSVGGGNWAHISEQEHGEIADFLADNKALTEISIDNVNKINAELERSSSDANVTAASAPPAASPPRQPLAPLASNSLTVTAPSPKRQRCAEITCAHWVQILQRRRCLDNSIGIDSSVSSVSSMSSMIPEDEEAAEAQFAAPLATQTKLPMRRYAL